MSEPLVKQIVDLKEEHSLMLEVLKMVEWDNNEETGGGMGIYCVCCGQSKKYGHTSNCLLKIAIKAAEEGNKRRVEQGNVEMP